jgi:hypothetical protein
MEKMRIYGGGPPYYKVGLKIIVYDLDDLDEWLAAGRRTSTSDGGTTHAAAGQRKGLHLGQSPNPKAPRKPSAPPEVPLFAPLNADGTEDDGDEEEAVKEDDQDAPRELPPLDQRGVAKP